ncbi:MAG: phosphatidylglycerophosphatase A [Balneolaceae bacterium]|nr:phosphatidylglycerophosphatase A [Balneolaceae bacterium]MBO6547701.1 phosphatidylglycerophosphatase A [Balneolaceae bacterium]MBO6648212.1 phosphatidylglycerophosphatase A [Balneolaceae bacterium]
MKQLQLFIGSGFGSGYLPVAPGTSGSLLALVLMYFILQIDPVIATLIIVATASLLTLWVSKTCEEEWGEDPGKLVIDEFAGQALVFTTIPLSGQLTTDIFILSTGLIFFRAFDIWKPLGINKVQKISGGTGILLDDLIAGFYAFICLKSLIFAFPNFFGFA